MVPIYSLICYIVFLIFLFLFVRWLRMHCPVCYTFLHCTSLCGLWLILVSLPWHEGWFCGMENTKKAVRWGRVLGNVYYWYKYDDLFFKQKKRICDRIQICKCEYIFSCPTYFFLKKFVKPRYNSFPIIWFVCQRLVVNNILWT